MMAVLLYGAGLRLLECARLRVKDLDFAANQIVVRSGKGDRDRDHSSGRRAARAGASARARSCPWRGMARGCRSWRHLPGDTLSSLAG